MKASFGIPQCKYLTGMWGCKEISILQIHNVQGQCWLCQRLLGGNPCQWSCLHDQKNLPKDLHQFLQDPRCTWRLCRLCSVPTFQALHGSKAASIHLLSEFSSLCVTLLLQLSFGDTHLIPAAVRGTCALWSCSSLLESHFCPTGHPWSYRLHSVGATVSWFWLV